jgi:photosystem II stability/assembly factor-like uncharacterized protein
VLYAGTTEGLWKSSDAGESWARISPANWIINAMILEPDPNSLQLNATSSSASRLLIGTEQQGVLASDDGGLHFAAANDGFYHRRVVSVAVDSQDPRRFAVVLANAPEPVMFSEDGGMNWAAMDSGLAPGSVRSIFYTPAGWLAALNAGGLARYDRARQSWKSSGIFLQSPATSQSPAPAEPGGIALPLVNDFYISRTGWLAATEQGLFTSQDLGKTWVSVPFAPTDFPVQSVRSSPDGKTIRIVSSHGMVFSDDAGHSWSWHDLPFESGGALKLEWTDESTLLAIAQAGVYISRDSGASWAKEQAGLPGARAQELLLSPSLWLASIESSGLYQSTNQGASWSRVKNGLENRSAGEFPDEFPVLAAIGKSRAVLAGSASEGLFLLRFDYALSVATPNANENSIPGGH